MAVKIRLQRHGKKGKPFYWVVAADARAKRDGRYLQKLGTYNPNTNPASVDLNVDECVKWLQNGAQPTHTAKALLSYKGILLKNHLLKGVKKGALSEDEAQKRFENWLEEKQSRIDNKVSKLEKEASDKKKKTLEIEKEESEKRKLKAAEAASAAEETPATEEAPATDRRAIQQKKHQQLNAYNRRSTSTEAPAAEETPAKEEALQQKKHLRRS